MRLTKHLPTDETYGADVSIELFLSSPRSAVIKILINRLDEGKIMRGERVISTSTRFSPSLPDDIDHYALCAFCFAYFHPVDQGNWYRGHCTENDCASPKAILTLRKTETDAKGFQRTSVGPRNIRVIARNEKTRAVTWRLAHPACTHGNLILMITDQAREKEITAVRALLPFLNTLLAVTIGFLRGENNGHAARREC